MAVIKAIAPHTAYYMEDVSSRSNSSHSAMRLSARNGCAAFRTGLWIFSIRGERSFDDDHAVGVELQYQKYEKDGPKPLLKDMLERRFESEHHRKFRANRSLRDVEPDVNLFLKDLSGMQVEDGA